MCEMEARCGLTPSPKHAHAAQSVVKRGTFREIWAPQYRQRTLTLMVMNFFAAIGFFGFGNWLPALLSGQAPASPIACCTPSYHPSLSAGLPVCTRFVHRFENKWQIVLSALMTVIFGTLFALQNNPILLVICGFMITLSNASAHHQLSRLPGQVFPTHIRARAVGFCYSFSRLSTAVTSILIGIILQYAGTPGVISFIVVSMLMVMLSVGISARERGAFVWRISDGGRRRGCRRRHILSVAMLQLALNLKSSAINSRASIEVII